MIILDRACKDCEYYHQSVTLFPCDDCHEGEEDAIDRWLPAGCLGVSEEELISSVLIEVFESIENMKPMGTYKVYNEL